MNESNILYQILDEIIQFSFGKIEINHELLVDLYTDSQNNNTKTIDKLFNVDDNLLFVLVIDNKIEFLLYLGKYNIKETKYCSIDNKNIDYECFSKNIYTLCRYIVNYCIG